MVDGRRITDKGTLDMVTMVYAGLINKQLVAGLQAAGCNAPRAVGRRRKRRHGAPPQSASGGLRIRGRHRAVDSEHAARRLLEGGITPVFWIAIMHDGKGTLLNCNADSVASSVALTAPARIAPHGLVFCFEKKRRAARPGRRDDADPRNHGRVDVRPALKAGGIVSKGMIPKVENALKAVANGVRSVTIKHSENLLNDTGTVIR